ncbi:hypothetical protein [Motilimonas sp. KMU-193]|uniref:hypothetical protein n=1 Tax=Motilimonas sp. KMU-193 TaxID=3388668 RepID=UPI00396AF0D6
MIDRILDLYSLLFKYAEKKLPKSEASSDLFEQMESGWDHFPSTLKGELSRFIKSVDTLEMHMKNDASDADIRNSLVSLKWSMIEVSAVTKMMAGDLEEILDQTLNIESKENVDNLSIDTCDYRKEILKNDIKSPEEFSESSFVSIFHENEIWDFKEYWKFDLAIYSLAKRGSQEEMLNLQTSVFSIYSSLLQSLGCYFDNNDLFSLSNLDYESLCSMRERLVLVVEGLFRNDMPSNDMFKFKNPYL